MNPSPESSETHSARPPWEVTGNHYLALPCISLGNAGIHRLNVLHRGALGLLEWASAREPEDGAGAPLLAPEVREEGRGLALDGIAWERVDRWIPKFRAALDGELVLHGTICAPGGGDLRLAGAVYRLELENRGRRKRSVEVALTGTWRWSLRTVATSRALTGHNRISRGRDASGIALELGGEPGLAALGVVVAGEDARYAVAVGDGEWREPGPGQEIGAANGDALRLRVARPVRVPPGRRVVVDFYLAPAVERDGALARAATLRRLGGDELIRVARLYLAQLVRRVRDPALGALLNRNLLFNAFFAVGRAVDDDRLYPVTSRSPLCRPSGVFRERDALLWSLPALILADSVLARETLIRAFEQFSHHPGGHVHYLDGGLLSPGFALDQYCAYVLALDRYVRETRDEAVLDEPIVGEVLRELDDLLLDRLHPEVFLAATELLPSGEPAVHPFVTYDNALVRAFCEALGRVWRARPDEEPARFADAGEEVAAAIWRHCTAEVDGLRVLAHSTDLAGEAAVYDDPDGSLVLLPYLGFCDADDPIWRNTVEWLHSPRYPFRLHGRPYPGQACRRRPGEASVAALCFGLLGPWRGEALDVLRRLTLESGVACETYDPDTGTTVRAPHHAAVAGLVAWTLEQAL